MVVSSETPLMDAASFANQPFGFSLQKPPDQREQDLLLLGARLVEEGGVAVLGAHAEVDEKGRVAAVVQDHVRHAAVVPVEQAGGEVPVFLERLALVGEDGDAGGGDGGGGMVLGRVDVAGDPADVGPERASVSISTAVWIVMWSEPAMRAPLSGCASPYSSRTAIRPGISVSAIEISLRPHSARPMSLTT